MPVLIMSCPDQAGIVARTASSIASCGGNIIDADQHRDTDYGIFVQRIEFDIKQTQIDQLINELNQLAQTLVMRWELFDNQKQRLVLLVSKEGHCLYDVLSRVSLGELNVEIAAVISNHETHSQVSQRFDVDFIHIPITPESKEVQNKHLHSALIDLQPDLIGLARYMQILPKAIVDSFSNKIINIHHSFLPAFIGANPYQRAHQRGVKIIGATAHYVTAELDEGPIISQSITHISHRESVEELIQKGGDIERIVFADALRLHLDHKLLVLGNRTIIFD